MSLFAFAWRHRAHLAIVSCGLLTLTGAIERGLLPDGVLGSLLGGYLAYALGAGGATLALLLVVGPLLERHDERVNEHP